MFGLRSLLNVTTLAWLPSLQIKFIIFYADPTWAMSDKDATPARVSFYSSPSDWQQTVQRNVRGY